VPPFDALSVTVIVHVGLPNTMGVHDETVVVVARFSTVKLEDALLVLSACLESLAVYWTVIVRAPLLLAGT
jgi:hypothetical protein